MRKKFLNSQQEAWLCLNYPTMSNEEIAVKLTDMVAKENEKQLKRLTDMLTSVTDAHVKRAIRSNINAINRFKGITPSYVRTMACRLGCAKKDVAVRSKMARKSAESRYVKKFTEMAIDMNQPPTVFFRSFRLNEKRVVRMKDEPQVKMVRTCMSIWNRDEGFEKGICLISRRVPGTTILRFEATLSRQA